MKIAQFDKTACKALRSSLNSDLAKIAKKHGISLKVGNIHFTRNEATIKLTANAIKGGQVLTKEAADWNRHAKNHGITKSVGDTFVSNGAEYKITGWSTRRHRFPISSIRVSDGRSFKHCISAIRPANPASDWNRK